MYLVKWGAMLTDYKPSSQTLSRLVEAFCNKDTIKKAKKAYKDAGI
jgi:hypothetical protein